MLYALGASDIGRLRSARFAPEFTGAEMLVAAYRTDPAVVAKILPRPLQPPEQPVAVAFVARYPQTNFGSVYNEGALLIRAQFRHEVGLYCLAMPVDDDMAMVGGRERLGFPKKMAERITLDSIGSQVVGRVVRKGIEILRIEAELDAPVEATDLDLVGPARADQNGNPCREAVSFLFKFSPSPGGTGFDYLPRLIRQSTLFRPRPGVKRGVGRVVVNSSPYDPLGDVPVIGPPITCFYGVWDNTMLPGRVLRRVWNVRQFLPHAFFKADAAPILLGWATSDRPKKDTYPKRDTSLQGNKRNAVEQQHAADGALRRR